MDWSWISRSENEADRELVRLMNRMKLGVQALFVVVLAGTMAFGALACPLWRTSSSLTEMPGSDPSAAHEKCPLVICLASSSYLTSELGIAIPPLTDLPDMHSELDGGISLVTFEPSHRDRGAPPDEGTPLFLRVHSLLI